MSACKTAVSSADKSESISQLESAGSAPAAAGVVHVHGRADELALGLGERVTAHRLGLEVAVTRRATERGRSVAGADVSHAHGLTGRRPSRPGPDSPSAIDDLRSSGPGAREAVVGGAVPPKGGGTGDHRRAPGAARRRPASRRHRRAQAPRRCASEANGTARSARVARSWPGPRTPTRPATMPGT